jgi:hypothetical protein
MDLPTAQEMLVEIEVETRGRRDLEDLKTDLFWAALRYARTRSEWSLLDREERNRGEAARTIQHKCLIDACDILARAARGKGLQAAWRDRLGRDRKETGDFACLLSAVLGLRSR